MEIETKFFNGKVTETKQESRNGVPIGIIAGYIATWDLDRCGDQFLKGCFAESLKDHQRKKRQVRLKGIHGQLIGGFPIDTVKEDDKGLFGIGEVNLNTQRGQEIFSLAQQGVIVDMSIGFSAIEQESTKEGRLITKAIVWEGSPVDEPMNEKANITEVKSAIEKASCIGELKEALSKVDEISPELVKSIIKYVEEKTKKEKIFAVENLKDLSDREFEDKLKSGVSFSGKNAKSIISTLKAAGLRDGDNDSHRDGEKLAELVDELKAIKQTIEGENNGW